MPRVFAISSVRRIFPVLSRAAGVGYDGASMARSSLTWRTAAPWTILAFGPLASLWACGELRLANTTPAADAATATAPEEETDLDATPSPDVAPARDAAPADATSKPTCRTLPLECLDPTPANVIEVPAEASLSAALASAKPDDIVQVRSAALTTSVVVPERVTLRGCAGAQIGDVVSFAGGSGTIEGFIVSGSIVADRTGTFTVRHNRFVSSATPSSAEGVVARSSSTTSEAVTVLVEANRFEMRSRGVAARTSNGPGARKVTMTVRNNLFAGVASPFVASNAVGTVDPLIEHNTFAGFVMAVSLQNVTLTRTRANIFAFGKTGIDSLGSDFEAFDSISWSVDNPFFTPPSAGTIAEGNPAFVDPDSGDYRLSPGSAAIDRIAAGTKVPSEDLAGCPRPAGKTTPPKSDVGALEAQP